MTFIKVLSDSWRGYKKNWKLYFKFIFLFAFLPSLIGIIINQFYLYQIGYNILNLGYLITTSIIGMSMLLIGVIASVGIYSSVIFNNKDYKNSKKEGLRYYWKYIGFYIVLTIFLMGLFLAFIVPGIMFIVYWSFAIFILFEKKKGIIDSLKESYYLVKGRWWKVLGYSLLFFLVIGLIGVLFSLLTAPSQILLNADEVANPNLYLEGSIPTTIQIIHTNISGFVDLLSNFVVFPLSVLFYWNFYLQLRKEKVKKKK